MAKKTTTRTMYRSAKTGKLVTESYAKSHPATTEKEHRRVPKRGAAKGTGGTGPRRK
jgi:hypothetical protein